MGLRRTVKKIIPKKLFYQIEPTGHLAEAVMLQTANRFPLKGVNVIGVTGTNGKTTTCFLIHRMLLEAGYKAGLMTTVAYGMGSDITPQIQHMTNVPVPLFLRRVKELKEQGMEWLVLETTSHALAQHRVWNVPYSIAVVTNVTHEHLDYHGTFERYVTAKKMLFKQTNQNKKGLRIGVINADDPVSRTFESTIAHPITYGVRGGDLHANKVELKPSEIRYSASIGNSSYDIVCNIPGSFNVYNSLAAVAVGHKLGLTKRQIEQGIQKLTGVEGRMTKIDEGQHFTVIVDFAHTPDSFEKLFIDLRPVVKGKLIVLFGSAGRRDETKRAIQGKLAGKFADEVIITEEDDRDVNGVEIMEDIARGAKQVGKKRDIDLFLVHDRTEAIHFALSRATSSEDTVLLLGKGHEKTIERADGEHPWDEINTAHTALKLLVNKD